MSGIGLSCQLIQISKNPDKVKKASLLFSVAFAKTLLISQSVEANSNKHES